MTPRDLEALVGNSRNNILYLFWQNSCINNIARFKGSKYKFPAMKNGKSYGFCLCFKLPTYKGRVLEETSIHFPFRYISIPCLNHKSWSKLFPSSSKGEYKGHVIITISTLNQPLLLQGSHDHQKLRKIVKLWRKWVKFSYNPWWWPGGYSPWWRPGDQ